MRSDLNLWNRNLWDNMVKSDEYICNVINLLNEGNIGLLVPPKPIGEYMDFWYTNPWNDNFEVTLSLAEKIGLECEVKYDDWDMVTLGTVFWCRTKALRKLFDYNWEYTDFPGEPMPDDGTISHAIERILGFVSVDAGYEVGTVMCSEYASDLNEMIQSKMQSTYKWLWHRVGIKNSFQLDRFDDEKATVDNMFSEFDRIYLYGAGHYGQIYLDRLSKWGYKPYGFVVSDGLRDSDIYLGYRVYELHEITQTDNTGIIICTNPELQEKLANYLRDRHIYNYYKAVVI
jgi:rhamnosyltransferase